MKQYALYLRKSRADVEAEARGEGETLAKHRAALTAYAKQRGLFIAKEYAEIVSGDTIAARPQMQQLLEDVKSGLYDGVIVNDVDRLGRGDSIDQEIIKYTFAAANCLIITPHRDIDPSSPTDQDTLDFGMFLARFEYRKIKQRMQEGRARSVASGNWIQSIAPYGYARKHENGRIFLVPDPDEAPIVKMIYDMRINDNIGGYAIASKLNAMGIHSRKNMTFSHIVINHILANPVYTGQLVYGLTKNVQIVNSDGTRSVIQKKTSNPIIIENAHEAIISKEVFEQAQRKLSPPPINVGHKMANPLCSLVYCSFCGKSLKMYKSEGKTMMLKCWTPGCKTSGKALSYVENAIMETLRTWCAQYETPQIKEQKKTDNALDLLQKQRASLDNQYKRAQELVELGVYSVAEFIQRRDQITQQIETIDQAIARQSIPTKETAISNNIPQIKYVLEAYPYAKTAEEKNKLLKTVLSKVIYHKTERNGKLTLEVLPYVDDTRVTI